MGLLSRFPVFGVTHREAPSVSVPAGGCQGVPRRLGARTFALGYFTADKDERVAMLERQGPPRSPPGPAEQHRPYKECNSRANVVSSALAHFCH